jgi:hypothetical protein
LESKLLDETSQKVSRWLQEAGLSVSNTQNVPDYYNVTVSPAPPATGPVLTVAKPKAETPFYAVGMGVAIHPDHRNKLNAETKQERGSFLSEIRYAFLLMNVDFMFIPPQGEVPQHIQIVKLTFNDGLTQNSLFNTYTNVRNAGLYAIWKFVERYGQPDIVPHGIV